MFPFDRECSRCCSALTVLLVTSAACTPRAPASRTSSGPPVGPAATTILREVSYPDSELAAQGRGRLEVVVRSTDRPTQALGGAYVRLRTGERDSVVRVTDDRGLAVFDSVAIGEHELTVCRLGYGTVRAVVAIKPGCRTDAEAYIAISAVGIAPPPPMPGRMVQTTCR